MSKNTFFKYIHTGATGLIGTYIAGSYYIEISERRWQEQKEDGKEKPYEEINGMMEQQGNISRSFQVTDQYFHMNK